MVSKYIQGRIWGRKAAVNWFYVCSRNQSLIVGYVRRLDLPLLVYSRTISETTVSQSETTVDYLQLLVSIRGILLETRVRRLDLLLLV